MPRVCHASLIYRNPPEGEASIHAVVAAVNSAQRLPLKPEEVRQLPTIPRWCPSIAILAIPGFSSAA